MVSRQLELGFENPPGLKPASRRRGRSGGADWWFEQMRGVVNHARDWAPAEANAIPLPPDRTTNTRITPEPRRWKFSRARRLIWE